jgi:G3E family GTPase
MSNDSLPTQPAQARLVVLGGFLGAGKTTAIAEFAKFLRARGQNAAVITNDHGSELVDSALLRAQGIFAHAIEGGELPAKTEETLRAARRLHHEQRARVIIAEPAGTCEDLAQTVLSPARETLAGEFSVAPLSVLVDPIRAARVLRLETGGKLAPEIASLYRKQLEEAEIIVINKIDLALPGKLPSLREALHEISPAAKIFSVSARTGAGLEEWFECLMTTETSATRNVPTDKSSATRGELLLAWLNCTVRVSSVRYFDAGKILLDLAGYLQSLLQQESAEIAHLKMALNPEQDGSGIAAVSLDRYDATPQLLRDISEPIQRGELILNVRAYGDPEILHSTVNRALLVLMERSPELFARMHHCEHFKAGRSRSAQ